MEPSNVIRGLQSTSLSNQHLQRLSPQQVDNAINEYVRFVQNMDYNTCGPVLELVGSLKKIPSNKSWKEVFSHFKPEVRTIIAKYHGGSTALIAEEAQKILGQFKIKAEICGESRPTSKNFELPTPFRTNHTQALVWEEAKSLGQGYSLFFDLIKYLDDQNNEKVITLQQNFIPNAKLANTFNSIDSFEKEFSRFNTQSSKSIEDVASIIKGSLQTTFVFQILNRENREVVKLNLLDGTITVQPGNFPNLPKNSAGKCVFSINDKKADTVLDIVQKQFHQPPDFKDNVMFLLNNREKYINEIMVSPALVLHQLWKPYCDVLLTREKAFFIKLKETRGSVKEDLFVSAEDAFNKGLVSLQKNDVGTSRKQFEEAEKFYQKYMNKVARATAVPLAAMLEDFIEP